MNVFYKDCGPGKQRNHDKTQTKIRKNQNKNYKKSNKKKKANQQE